MDYSLGEIKFEYDTPPLVGFIPLLRDLLLKRGVAALGHEASIVEKEIKEELSSKGRGRTYKRYNPTRTHRASAPGDAPAVDLGSYRASWRTDVVRLANHVEMVVWSPLWNIFGRRLELGGWGGIPRGYIAPRPHLRPVLERLQTRLKHWTG